MKERQFSQQGAKKSLGQNFFTDKVLAEEIAKMVLSNNPASLIEIGPGKGAFSEFFYKKMRSAFAMVEIDDELVYILRAFYPEATVIHGDILDLEILRKVKEFSRKNTEQADERAQYTTVFGALPYNISKKIIRLVLEEYLAEEYWFIIQKEVADLLVSPKSGQFKLFTEIYADTQKIKELSPHFFSPRPKVTSQLIRLTPNDNIRKIEKLTKLERLIKASFRFPRKTLANNLKGTEFERIIADTDYAKRRPEDLQLSDFITVSNAAANKASVRL